MSEQETPWGERKRPVFQKHAVTISQRLDGRFITEGEAHYVCAIMNCTSVEQFVMASNDKRGFKIRLPFRIPLFDPDDPRHRKLVWISKAAHTAVTDARFSHKKAALVALACSKADALYCDLLRS